MPFLSLGHGHSLFSHSTAYVAYFFLSFTYFFPRVILVSFPGRKSRQFLAISIISHLFSYRRRQLDFGTFYIFALAASLLLTPGVIFDISSLFMFASISLQWRRYHGKARYLSLRYTASAIFRLFSHSRRRWDIFFCAHILPYTSGLLSLLGQVDGVFSPELVVGHIFDFGWRRYQLDDYYFRQKDYTPLYCCRYHMRRYIHKFRLKLICLIYARHELSPDCSEKR